MHMGMTDPLELPVEDVAAALASPVSGIGPASSGLNSVAVDLARGAVPARWAEGRPPLCMIAISSPTSFAAPASAIDDEALVVDDEAPGGLPSF